MRAPLQVSRTRCLLVGTSLTGVLWAAAAAGARAALAAPAPRWQTTDDALVRLCLAGLVLAALWAWLQAMAGVADAWRGTAAGRGGVVRRLALVACGVALTTTWAGPADAEPEEPRRLSGLPLPQRAEGAAARASHDRVVVRTGDSLWAIAARHLGDRADDREIDHLWRAVHAANRGLIGPDPDLIHPGQVLRITKEKP